MKGRGGPPAIGVRSRSNVCMYTVFVLSVYVLYEMFTLHAVCTQRVRILYSDEVERRLRIASRNVRVTCMRRLAVPPVCRIQYSLTYGV